MEHAYGPISEACVRQWQSCRTHALEALRLPFPLLVVIFGVLGGAWAGLSTYLRQVATGVWEPADFRTGVATVIVCVTILLYLRSLRRVSIRALCELRQVVPIATETYERLALRMLLPRPLAEFLLLVISTVLFVVIFVLQPDELSILPRSTFLDWAALVFLSLFACLAIWIVLTLVYTGIRSSLALRALAQSPLIVNAFDPAALLPFGRLGALHSLGFVGVVLIPMAILGPPKAGGGYVVLMLSLASLALLFVPLWGVHRQIVHARERVLLTIADDLMAVQSKLLSEVGRDPAEAKLLYEQAGRLTSLRSSILSSPSWPFRDNGALARLVTALFFPTLVAVISYSMQRFVFPLITHTP